MALDLYFIDVVSVDTRIGLRAGMSIDPADIEHSAAEPVWPGVHDVCGNCGQDSKTTHIGVAW